MRPTLLTDYSILLVVALVVAGGGGRSRALACTQLPYDFVSSTRRDDRPVPVRASPRARPGLGSVEGAADQVGAAASAHLGAGDRSGSEPALDQSEQVGRPRLLRPVAAGTARSILGLRRARLGTPVRRSRAAASRSSRSGATISTASTPSNQGRGSGRRRRGQMQTVMSGCGRDSASERSRRVGRTSSPPGQVGVVADRAV